MKKSFLSATLLILFLILISSNSSLSARFIATKQGKREVELGRITDMEEIEPMDQLMGVEEACDSGDEECMKRRIISEAHLDYIYTQRRKP